MKQADNCALDIQSHANQNHTRRNTVILSFGIQDCSNNLMDQIKDPKNQPLSKWLITKVSLSPRKSRVVGPLPNGRTSWLINGGYYLYLLTGMILQAP